jgi:hypothetical protein
VPAIVAALGTHASVPAVAQYACWALVNIASIPAGQTACVSEGAVPAIVAALRTQASVPAVAERACEALLNLTCASPPAIQACLAVGGEDLLRAAEASRPAASKAACWALCNLSPAACADSRIAASAVAEITLSLSMNAHCSSSFGTLLDCWSLANIAFTNPVGKNAIVERGGLAALVAVLGGPHASDPCVAAHACKALRNISIAPDSESRKVACIDAGAVSALAAALSTHAGCPAVVLRACLVLGNIAAIPAGQDACVAQGEVPPIVAALRDHAGEAGVVRYAAWALRIFAWSSASNRAAIVAAGAVPLLAAVHAAHSGEARKNAREALGRLGYGSLGQRVAVE